MATPPVLAVPRRFEDPDEYQGGDRPHIPFFRALLPIPRRTVNPIRPQKVGSFKNGAIGSTSNSSHPTGLDKA